MEIPVNDPDGLSKRKQQERRQHPRTKVKVAIELRSERIATPLRVQTADLSIGGLYVEMMFTLEVGTKLKIVLWINDVNVSTYGVVVTRDLHVGNGIKFTDMAPEDRERIKDLLTAAAASNASQGEAPLKLRAIRDELQHFLNLLILRVAFALQFFFSDGGVKYDEERAAVGLLSLLGGFRGDRHDNNYSNGRRFEQNISSASEIRRQ